MPCNYDSFVLAGGMACNAATYREQVQSHNLASLEFIDRDEKLFKYSLPTVFVKEETTEPGLQIDCKWPQGSNTYFDWSDQSCSIIRVDVRTVDDGMKSVFACNCLRDDQIGPSSVLEIVEKLLAKCYSFKDLEVAPLSHTLESCISDAIHDLNRLQKPEGGTALSALRCTHIDCIKAMQLVRVTFGCNS